MKLGWPGSGWRRAAAHLVAAAAVLVLSASGPALASSQDLPSDPGWRDVTLAQYQQHLKDLDALVAACQNQRSQQSGAGGTKTSFSACDPAQIGPNSRVQGLSAVGSQTREVRYDWLRSVLARAENKTGAAQKDIFGVISHANKKPVSVDTLLAAARQRLEDDAAQAENPVAASPNYSDERKTLNSILAQRAYRGVTEESAIGRFQEWLANLLGKFLSGLVRFGSNAPWIVWLLRILLLVGLCTALIWFLLRIERRSHIRLIPEIELATGAPSAREWQLWLRDAQAMAAQGEWREAIHFLYWASIARLESKRLWPADRARTPREYLALLSGTDPRKPSLSALTRNFERTWYGGRAAQASDFNAALEQAAALGVAAE
ncbi:MAG: DUF4129 domain-containing protein [Terracidiphilus sp.]|jgi:hypothetical protein